MKWILVFLIPFTVHAFMGGARQLHSEQSHDPNGPWIQAGDTEERAFNRLFKILKESPTGRKILKGAIRKASQQGKTLRDIVRMGEVSITDTTLVRRFYPSKPEQMIFESKAIVYVDKTHKLMDAVLDLAHELTHYNEKQGFNPYQQKFTYKQFVVNTIEGPGGEVEAYLRECKVMREIYPQYYRNSSNCPEVEDVRTGRPSRNLGVSKFYQLGNFKKHFHAKVKELGGRAADFNHVSDDTPIFISSAYGMPYPVAALEEYNTIMKKVCENDYRRLEVMRDGLNRRPAEKREATFREFRKTFYNRCARYQAELVSYLGK